MALGNAAIVHQGSFAQIAFLGHNAHRISVMLWAEIVRLLVSGLKHALIGAEPFHNRAGQLATIRRRADLSSFGWMRQEAGLDKYRRHRRLTQNPETSPMHTPIFH